MERSSITRLVIKSVDMDGVSHSTNQTAANQSPTIPPSGSLPCLNAFTHDIGDHTVQENPLQVAVHALPDGISAEERAEIKQLLDKMLECVTDSQHGYHAHFNNNAPHAAPASLSQPLSNDAQGGTPWIDPRLPYWYSI